ncbi:hypothetical protein Pelo_5799 [Pelomyxa schiedti]|nr:hypothetical protein Pelo_5799 [Pelomyxa schiedti]
MRLEIDDTVLIKHKSHQVRLVIVNESWWRGCALDRMSLALLALKRAKWCKVGPTLEEALCLQCNPENGTTVQMNMAPLPKSANVIEFSVKPKCSSSRVHLKSQIVLVIDGIPGTQRIVSNPVSLFSRGLRGRKKLTQKQVLDITQICDPTLAEMSLQTPFYIQQSILYSQHSRLPPSTLSVAPSSMVLSWPFQEKKRPVVGIIFLSTPYPQQIFPIYRNLIVQSGGVACFGFLLPGGCLAMIDVCPGLKESITVTYATILFGQGQNPFQVNLFQANPYLSVLGWASNLLS